MENNSSNLNVSKEFECSKEVLFNAWTQPEQLKQWWKPMGNTLTDVVNDIREGGEVKYVFEGNKLTIDGKYEKVEGHNLLEYTWNWHMATEPVPDAPYKLSVRFEGNDDNRSTISVTQTGFKEDESVQPHQQGWEQGLQQLHDFLSNNKSSVGNSASASSTGNAGNSTEEAAQKNMPPMTGYMETPEQTKVAGG
jgi:uncharacterized protein YndB with AHSA1/START domain